MASSESKATVVVVGGGVGGSAVVKSLQYVADVVLIDPKEYYEIPWANLRAMVEPAVAQRIVISHNEYFVKGKIVTSAAVGVTENGVMTADGNTIAYDYLVIATGHMDPVPAKKSDRLAQYLKEQEKIKSAGSILIVGGGPTGVELAGEIAVDFPDKKITIVHRGSRLLEFINPKASKKTLDWLTKRNVNVILEQSVDVDSVTDGVYTTSGGEKIKADCHFFCVGSRTGSSWLRETFLKDSLDGQGRLTVDANLRVKGHSNIFAIGDINDVPEIKLGHRAVAHAQLTAKNLKALISKGSNEVKLGSYKPGASIAIVSLGRKEGVAQFPFMTVTGCIPGKIKSGDMFVGKTRKQLGLKP